MKQFFGAILLGCGVLIAGLSGLCAGFIVLSALAAGSGTSSELAYLPAFLIVAAVPFVIGVAMVLGGRHVIRTVDKEVVQANEGSQADIFK